MGNGDDSAFLRKLEILSRMPKDSSCFDPLLFVQAVNEAQALGQRRLLDAAQSNIESHHGPEMLYWLLRVLFPDLDPASAYPFYRYDIAEPPRSRLRYPVMPLYPILLIADVPLLVYHGSVVGGITSLDDWQKYVNHLRYTRTRLRLRPLTPTADVFGALRRAVASEQWPYGKRYPTRSNDKEYPPIFSSTAEASAREESYMMRQLLRLTRNVYPRPMQEGIIFSPYAPLSEPQWQTYAQEFQKLNVRWDPQINDYVK